MAVSDYALIDLGELKRHLSIPATDLSQDEALEALIDGADGGILASAHVETAVFAEVGRLMTAGEPDAALARWRSVADLTRLLFAEPSPAPIKYWLWRAGLIESAEVRLPMTEVSGELAARLDLEIERRMGASA